LYVRAFRVRKLEAEGNAQEIVISPLTISQRPTDSKKKKLV
jgi:hypothetical protein